MGRMIKTAAGSVNKNTAGDIVKTAAGVNNGDNRGANRSVINRRVFYVAGIADASVMAMLNIMRFAANPDATRQAHITIRGPYCRRLPAAAVNRFSRMIDGAQVCINGAGVFFAKGQNTVYLHCHSPQIKAAWHKPQHSYTPHLTIYDGKSRAIATAIRDALENANINQTRPITALAEMLSPTTTPELRPAISAIPPKILTKLTGITPPDALATAPWQTRLQTLKTAANHLANL